MAEKMEMWYSISHGAGIEFENLPLIGVICSGNDGYFLIWYDGLMKFLGDTWHLTLGDAFHQSVCQFGVTQNAWQEHAPVNDQFEAIAVAQRLASS